MEINGPDVLAKLEAALRDNLPDMAITLFRQDTRTIRCGVAENRHGHEAITAYRQRRAAARRQSLPGCDGGQDSFGASV